MTTLQAAKTLQSLPADIHHIILDFCTTRELLKVAVTSQAMHTAATTILYNKVLIDEPWRLYFFLYALIARPSLRDRVRILEMEFLKPNLRFGAAPEDHIPQDWDHILLAMLEQPVRPFPTPSSVAVPISAEADLLAQLRINPGLVKRDYQGFGISDKFGGPLLYRGTNNVPFRRHLLGTSPWARGKWRQFPTGDEDPYLLIPLLQKHQPEEQDQQRRRQQRHDKEEQKPAASSLTPKQSFLSQYLDQRCAEDLVDGPAFFAAQQMTTAVICLSTGLRTIRITVQHVSDLGRCRGGADERGFAFLAANLRLLVDSARRGTEPDRSLLRLPPQLEIWVEHMMPVGGNDYNDRDRPWVSRDRPWVSITTPVMLPSLTSLTTSGCSNRMCRAMEAGGPTPSLRILALKIRFQGGDTAAELWTLARYLERLPLQHLDLDLGFHPNEVHDMVHLKHLVGALVDLKTRLKVLHLHICLCRPYSEVTEGCHYSPDLPMFSQFRHGISQLAYLETLAVDDWMLFHTTHLLKLRQGEAETADLDDYLELLGGCHPRVDLDLSLTGRVECLATTTTSNGNRTSLKKPTLPRTLQNLMLRFGCHEQAGGWDLRNKINAWDMILRGGFVQFGAALLPGGALDQLLLAVTVRGGGGVGPRGDVAFGPAPRRLRHVGFEFGKPDARERLPLSRRALISALGNYPDLPGTWPISVDVFILPLLCFLDRHRCDIQVFSRQPGQAFYGIAADEGVQHPDLPPHGCVLCSSPGSGEARSWGV